MVLNSCVLSKPDKSKTQWRNAHPVSMDFTSVSGSIILSGASGILGSALHRALDSRDIPTIQLVRRTPTSEGQLQWNPGASSPSKSGTVEDATAAIHLSGTGIGAHRWTEAYRHELAASRIDSTHRLAKVLAALRTPPRTFLWHRPLGFMAIVGMKC